MKKTRLTEEQMVKILRQADKSPVAEVAKKHGVSEVAIHAWRKRFGASGRRQLVGRPGALSADRTRCFYHPGIRSGTFLRYSVDAHFKYP